MSSRARTLALATVLTAGGLALPPLVAHPATAADGGRPLSAVLTGAAEVPGPGDPDGTGSAFLRVNPGAERLCVVLTVTGIEPARAAHVHRAPEGVAGPVVVPLEPPTSGTSDACYAVDRALALDLLQHPEQYYVNVHNAPYPAGAVRGQLGR